MMLHASELSFKHPVTKESIAIKAKLQVEFKRMINELGFELIS